MISLSIGSEMAVKPSSTRLESTGLCKLDKMAHHLKLESSLNPRHMYRVVVQLTYCSVIFTKSGESTAFGIPECPGALKGLVFF